MGNEATRKVSTLFFLILQDTESIPSLFFPVKTAMPFHPVDLLLANSLIHNVRNAPSDDISAHLEDMDHQVETLIEQLMESSHDVADDQYATVALRMNDDVMDEGEKVGFLPSVSAMRLLTYILCSRYPMVIRRHCVTLSHR